MKTITSLLFIFFTMASWSQNFEWLKTPAPEFNTTISSIGYPVASDASGNVFMAGFKSNPFLYTEVFGTVFLNKYNAAGDLLFSKSISGNAAAFDLATDANGNVIMAVGYVNSMVVENLGFLTSNQGVQFMVLKFNSEGELQWYMPLADEEDFINDFHTITTDSANNIYIGYGDYSSTWIKKLSPGGQTIMTITQSDVNLLTSLDIDTEGNIYAAGSCAGADAHFAGVARPLNGLTYNTYAVKYSADGIFQWQKYIDDITCPFPKIKANTPDEVYFSSYLFGSYSFDNFQTEGPDSGSFSDFFLTKLNSQGQVQWVRETYSNARVEPGKNNFLDIDPQGNVLFIGATAGNISWGNNLSTATVPFTNDAFLIKYNPEGNVIMATNFGGEDYDLGSGITTSSNGAMYMSGVSYGNATFGTIQHSDTNHYYPFLVKIIDSDLAISNPEQIKLSLYPNPSSDFIRISGIPSAKASIYNTIGQKIKDIEIEDNLPISITELAKGAYIIRLNGAVPLKFIKS